MKSTARSICGEGSKQGKVIIKRRLMNTASHNRFGNLS